MKTKFIAIIVLISTNLLLGQSYIPMIVKGNQWNVLYIDNSFSPEHPKKTWNTVESNVGAKVLLDSVTYYKIRVDSGNNSDLLISEDTIDKKVFLRHDVGGDVWDELLYDFSMKPNDTMVYYSNQKNGDIHYVIRVDSIRDISIGSGFKTREFYNSCRPIWEPEFHPCGNWIEGIGTFYGINPKQKIGIDGDYLIKTLLCFKKNDELFYMNPDYDSCDENSNSVDEIGYKKLKILNNPVDNYLSVELPEEEFWTDYLITSISGKVILLNNIKSQNNLNINVSKLQSGLYFIRVNNGKGRFSIGKFIVN